jgi:hypothetical protein
MLFVVVVVVVVKYRAKSEVFPVNAMKACRGS